MSTNSNRHVLSVSLACAVSAFAASGGVAISEIQAKNVATVRTANGHAGLDWIELHNDGGEDVDVAGWYLSDNPKKSSAKWKTILVDGAAVVPAGGYLVVWADKDCTDFALNEPHVPIGLSVDGESLFVAPPGTSAVEADAVFTFGRQTKDVSYGVAANGERCYFRVPTPGAANASEGFGPPSPAVEISEPHGFKTAPFAVTLSVADGGDGTVYYTTDGTEPTDANGVRYAGLPIAISTTTVLRASVPVATAVLQTVSTATYLFVGDILEQRSVPGGAFPTGSVNGVTLEYGLDAGTVAAHRREIAEALTNSIPVYSVAGDTADFFDAQRGIYVNGRGEGRDWERKVSVELFDPLGREEGFQIDCGIRLRGAYSRYTTVKHAFRLFFRSEYGAGKLDYPLFGDEGAKSFNKIDLRTSHNNSWAMDRCDRDTFIHETFCRDVQRDQGRPYTRSRYCHLFLNGQYWGLYETQERDDADYAADYLGGDSSDWDAVRTSMINGSYVTVAADGSCDAFDALVSLANAGVTDVVYQRMKGCNSDGTENSGYPVYLDDGNLMDYVIGLHYEHDPDGPFSIWNGLPNNLHSLYNRNAREGFVWLRHDGEHAMGMTTHYYNPASSSCLRWGHISGNFTHRNFTPAGLHARLADRSPLYRVRFAERLDAQCFQPDGILSEANARKRFADRMREVDGAIWAESARWGRGLFDKQTWSNACASCLNDFIGKRTEQLRRYYVAEGWYPTTAAPEITVPGGKAAYGVTVRVESGEGTQIAWTDDGSDPAESPTARMTEATLLEYVLEERDVTLRARAYDLQKKEWSFLSERNIVLETMSDAERQRTFMRAASLGSDAGGYVTLTNRSRFVSVALSGMRLVFAGETRSGVAEAGETLLAIADGVTCAASQCLRFAVPAATNFTGEIALDLQAADGETVQALRVSSDWAGFGETETGGAHFEAIGWDASLESSADWRPVPNFSNAVSVAARMGTAADPAVATRVKDVEGGMAVSDWAFRNGMTLGEALAKERLFVSVALDAAGVIDAQTLAAATNAAVEIRGVSAGSGEDAMTLGVAVPGIAMGTQPAGRGLAQLFEIGGCTSLGDGFKTSAVTLETVPTSDGAGGALFRIRPADGGADSFFVRVRFCP